MKTLAYILTVAALSGAVAGPAPAQDVGAQSDVQAQGVIDNAIDALIGNRYKVSDRQAIRTCGWAAVDRAERDYRKYFGNGHRAYPGYRGYVRVVAITDFQRRTFVTRVKGLLDTPRKGYRGPRSADLTFRCDVDGKGRVSNLKLDRTRYW
jgi:hypothetical protein